MKPKFKIGQFVNVQNSDNPLKQWKVISFVEDEASLKYHLFAYHISDGKETRFVNEAELRFVNT